ncbi:MAG: TatD family hydrolase [Alphaproteobacteria bacterium]|nr:TatD family hydrolase [Alphaproteobacteria bacterium]
MPTQIYLVDSHCHLNFPELKDDLPGVIARAGDAGVKTLLTINTRLDQSTEIQDIADRFPGVYCTVGVHPHDAAEFNTGDLHDQLVALSKHPKVIGVGETGLDYHYNKSPRTDQIESFKTHIRTSIDLGLPLVIHTRDADQDTIDCLRPKVGAKGVFHCFSGDLALAKAALDLGFYISFSGIITFKKADALREIVRYTPLDRLLVETDSPFLAPIPHRGQPNQPAYTLVTALKVAEIKGVSLEHIAEATTRNFQGLFLVG